MSKNRRTNKRKSFSRNQHSFAVSPMVSRPRSTFSRPSRTVTAIDAGILYPVNVEEILPGDTFSVTQRNFGRLATPLKPFMDNLWLDTFVFFVPHRLVWEHWQQFQGERDSPLDDPTIYNIPEISIAGNPMAGLNKLADYMGLPTQATNNLVSSLPFRSYNLIWNEFFRDQNIQDPVVVDKDDANSTETDYVLLNRGKRKDYFTGALPWPSKGDAVDIPIGGTAPVVSTAAGTMWLKDQDGTEREVDSTTLGNLQLDSNPLTAGQMRWPTTQLTNLEANLNLADGVTLNTFRNAVAIARVLELDARTGTRYVEALKGRWGVTSPDFRLQRPEYISGASQNISVIPVPATTDQTLGDNKDVGDLGGYGITAGQNSYTHSFTEHGTLLTLVSVRSDYMYWQGTQRMWHRSTREDFYEPELAHLGEQPIYQKEIYTIGASNPDDDIVFGYQERFSEYKYGHSMCTGIMRPGALSPLSQWHLAQQFTSAPTLDENFIIEDPPIDRVIAINTEPHLLLDVFFSRNCTRVMPVFNTPGLERL